MHRTSCSSLREVFRASTSRLARALLCSYTQAILRTSIWKQCCGRRHTGTHSSVDDQDAHFADDERPSEAGRDKTIRFTIRSVTVRELAVAPPRGLDVPTRVAPGRARLRQRQPCASP
eukprot:6198080-Pleurochrysis_carterae.AAC.1